MKKLKEENQENGITLIALVITIIVLLILAGITITSLTGKNGILTKAQEAQSKTEDAQKKELENLNNIDKIMYGAPIPDNFYYVGGTLETGIVISDNKNDENKGTDYQSTLSLKGNQFVWIPVLTPICDEIINLDNYSNKEEAVNTIINKINADSNKKGYPMSIKIIDGENVEYVSVLYNIELNEKLENNNTYSVSFTALPYSIENGCYREPDIASTADSMSKYLDILNFDSIEAFETDLHNQYNKMIESVIKYNGFYVARYETTVPDEHKEEDKNDNICCFKAQRDVMINKNWYEFYKMHENYGTSIKSNIQSNSIWGCQWDQMMLFMKDIKNVLDNKPYIISAIGMGTEPNGNIAKSASDKKYSAKNIFDIAGNVYEYTLETRSATTHTKRSSCYQKGANVVYANLRNYVIIQDESNTGSIYDGGRCSFTLN